MNNETINAEYVDGISPDNGALPQLPYGYCICSCEKYPKVEYANDRMLDFLEINEDSPDWHDFLKQNVYFMIPFEERDLFKTFLNRAILSDDPVHIEHDIIKGSGKITSVAGWVYCSESDRGDRKFIFLYLPTVRAEPLVWNNSYFNALCSAYNIIFEVNLSKKTVECIHGKETTLIGNVYDIRMTIESAKKYWLNNYIVPEDREMMADYFEWITTPGSILEEKRPLQAEFSIVWDNHNYYKMLGVSVELDSNTILFCCRDITDVRFPSTKLQETEIPSKGIYARTFGHFDFFTNGNPVTFSSAKEKELLALLIDRNGGTLSSSEAISLLWETNDHSDQLKARYRKLAMGLKNTLEKFGAKNVIINDRGTRSINKNALQCDYYELIAGSETAKARFHNTYMTDYSWAEETLASLWDYS